MKEAIVVYWLREQLRDVVGPVMEEAMNGLGFVSRAATLLDASSGWWEAHRSFALPYIRHRFHCFVERQGEDPTADVIPAYEHLIRLGQEKGELSDAVPAARMASYLHFLALSALLDWLAVPDRQLADRYADALDFFLQGARQPRGTPSAENQSAS